MKFPRRFAGRISQTLYVAEDGTLYCVAYRVIGIEKILGFLGFLTAIDHDLYRAK